MAFQKYLPICLWAAGYKRGKKPELFDNKRMMEFLETALPLRYTTRFLDIGWNVTSDIYEAFISRIEGLEPSIKKVIEGRKTLAELRKEPTRIKQRR